MFVASRVAIVLFLAGQGTDLGIHAGYAAQVVAGQLPFRDFFPEYPPLALAFTYLPALFDPSLHWYFPIFRSLCCAVDCGIWLYLLRLNRDRPAQNLLYVLGTTAVGPLLYDRIDLALGGLMLVAVASLLKGRGRAMSAAVGVGIAFKLIPLVWVPAALGSQWRAEGATRGRRLGRALLLLSVPAILTFDAIAMAGGYHFEKFFDYHARRGIQIESTPAAVEMALMRLGAAGDVTLEYGSVNLHTRYEGVLIRASGVLLGLLALGSGVVAARSSVEPGRLALLFGGVLAGALFLSKVLSPQFFLFLLPVLVVLPAPARPAGAVANWLLILVIVALTGVIFPWCYQDLIVLRPAAQVLLIARNGLLGVLSASLLVRAWKHSAPAPGNDAVTG
jgi:hypothetical protein